MISNAAIVSLVLWTFLVAAALGVLGGLVFGLTLYKRQHRDSVTGTPSTNRGQDEVVTNRLSVTAIRSTNRRQNEALTHWLSTIAILAGAAGYIYVFGAAQLLMNFTADGLPGAHALDVYNSRRFLTIGLTVAALVLGLTAVTASLGGIVYWRINRHSENRDTMHHAIAPLAVSALVVFTLFVTFALPYLRSFHIRLATVLEPGGACVVGPFISDDATGVHLIDGHTKQLLTIPSGDVESFTIDHAAPLITLGRITEGRASAPGDALAHCVITRRQHAS